MFDVVSAPVAKTLASVRAGWKLVVERAEQRRHRREDNPTAVSPVVTSLSLLEHLDAPQYESAS
jgi:hypothetical protein